MKQNLPVCLWKIVDENTYDYMRHQLLTKNPKPCCNLQNIELESPNCVEQWLYKPENRLIIFQGFKPFCDAHATRKKYEILNYNKSKDRFLVSDIKIALNVMKTVDVDEGVLIEAIYKATNFHIKRIRKEIRVLSNMRFNRKAIDRLEQVGRSILFLLTIDQPSLIELEEYYWFLLASAVKLENCLALNNAEKSRPFDQIFEEIYCGLAKKKNQIFLDTGSTLQNPEFKKNKLKHSKNYLARKAFANRRR